VSGPTEPEETGLILDLSRGGCRLESPLLILPGLSLELRENRDILHFYQFLWVYDQSEARIDFIERLSRGKGRV
jgi:hypothetical protein